MNDRRQLLGLLTALLLGVAVICSGFTGYCFQSAAARNAAAGRDVKTTPAEPAKTLDAGSFSSVWGFALGGTLIFVIAGATVLLRVTGPFVRRLQQSERQTRAVLDSAADGIVTVCSAGVIQSVNRAARRMFNVTSAEVCGRELDLLFALAGADAEEAADNGPAQAADSPAILAAILAAAPLLGIRPQGRFPVEISHSEASGSDDACYVLIVRDVTRRRAADEEKRRHLVELERCKEHLEAKAAELAKTNRELDDFTYVASHDLKEPLRGISAYCQILLEDFSTKLGPEGERRLRALVGLCNRLSELIDDLLAYSRIGRAQPARDELDLSQLLSDVLATLGPAIEERRGQIVVQEPLGTVWAEPTLVREIFCNLISNGLKFNESETPRVEIGCLNSAEEEGDSSLDSPRTFFVRDNGIGVAEQHHEAVFAMFRRLHSRRKYDGAGAGLTIVRKIVEAHGGRIWLESEVGAGSTFYFTLAPGRACVREELFAGTAD